MKTLFEKIRDHDLSNQLAVFAHEMYWQFRKQGESHVEASVSADTVVGSVDNETLCEQYHTQEKRIEFVRWLHRPLSDIPKGTCK